MPPHVERLVPALALAALLAGCDVLGGLFAPAPTRSPSPSPSPSAAPSASPVPGASPAPAATPTSAPDPRLPSEPAVIEGEIISAERPGAGVLHQGQIQVLGADGRMQAVASLTAGTAVWRRDAAGNTLAATAQDLQVGLRVRVWASGPVRESFPLQFTAKAVLVLPSAPAEPAG